MGSFFSDHPGAVAAIIVGVLLLFVIGALFFFFLGPVSTGGLVRAAVEHDDGRAFAFGQAWQAGLRTFWRVLGLRLLEIVVLLFALGILGIVALISLAASGFSSGSFGSLGLVFVLIILVSVATQVVFTLAVRAAVMDDRSITQALESSIALVRRRLGPVALVWVISIAISIGIAIALFVALAIVAIPFVLLGVITYAAGAGIGIPLVLGILVAVVVLLVAVGAAAPLCQSSGRWPIGDSRASQLPRSRRQPADRPEAARRSRNVSSDVEDQRLLRRAGNHHPDGHSRAGVLFDVGDLRRDPDEITGCGGLDVLKAVAGEESR